MKTTRKRVYLSDQNFAAGLVGTDDEPAFNLGPDDKTFVLDRVALEEEGRADAPSKDWSWGTFYLRLEDAIDPWHRREASPSPEVVEALEALRLTWPYDRAALRAAYRRRSKEVHPDAGGDAKSFVEVNAAYETIQAGVMNWPEFDPACT